MKDTWVRHNLFDHFFAAIDIVINTILFLIYRFEFWHVLATPHRRKYKKAIQEFLITQSNYQVIDIGCGLGDNIKSITGAIGLDKSFPVLKAAKKKNSCARYLKYEFQKDDLQMILSQFSSEKPRLFLGVNFLQKNNFELFIDELRNCSVNGDDLLVLDFMRFEFAKKPEYSWMPQLEQIANENCIPIVCDDRYRVLRVYKIKEIKINAT